VPLRRILLTSFIGYGISNNTGHAWASGGSVRYRFYSDAGVPGRDIAKISLFLALTFLVGVVTLGSERHPAGAGRRSGPSLAISASTT
jgi:phosphatidylglycerol lysyltransferase